MNLRETLDTLKSLGKEQTRKTYRRHGAGEDVYGVNTPDLKSLQKKIKVDQALAGEFGAAYAIPVLYVPLLMITHAAAFYLLLHPQSKAAPAFAAGAPAGIS